MINLNTKLNRHLQCILTSERLEMHPSGIAQSISITHSELDSPIVFSCELLIFKVENSQQHFYFASCYPLRSNKQNKIFLQM